MSGSSLAALHGVGLAGISNAIAACFTNPVDVIKVRMQLAGVSKLTSCDAHTVLTAGRKLWQHEGVQGLYRGLQPSILRELSYSGVRMGLYEPVREMFLSFQGGKQSTSPLLIKICAGAFTGAVGSVLANPFDLLKVRMQGAELKQAPMSVVAAGRAICQEAGISGLWRGAGPTVQRATLLTASQVPSYDHAKHTLLDQGLLKEGYFCHFSCSMLAGVVAAGVTSALVYHRRYDADFGIPNARQQASLADPVGLALQLYAFSRFSSSFPKSPQLQVLHFGEILHVLHPSSDAKSETAPRSWHFNSLDITLEAMVDCLVCNIAEALPQFPRWVLPSKTSTPVLELATALLESSSINAGWTLVQLQPHFWFYEHMGCMQCVAFHFAPYRTYFLVPITCLFVEGLPEKWDPSVLQTVCTGARQKISSELEELVKWLKSKAGACPGHRSR
eukprot:g15353.t1